MYSHHKDYKKIKELIEQYISDSKGEATQNDVVHYISGMQDVPQNQKTSRVITIKLIKELEAGGRIKVSKGERQGQSHRLRINIESLFNKYSQNLPDIQKLIEDLEIPLGREADLIMWNFLFKLDFVNRLPFEKDAQILNQKILKLLLLLAAKKIESRK